MGITRVRHSLATKPSPLIRHFMSKLNTCFRCSDYKRHIFFLILDTIPLFLQMKIIWYLLVTPSISSGFPDGSAGKASACNAGDLGSIPGLGRSPGEGNGYQYSSLENSMDCIVHGVTKCLARLSDFHTHTSSSISILVMSFQSKKTLQ